MFAVFLYNKGYFIKIGNKTSGTLGTTKATSEFVASNISSKVVGVHELTLPELNRTMNTVKAGTSGYTDRTDTTTTEGFKDLTGTANGIFDLQDLSNYSASYYYWLASPYPGDAGNVCSVYYYDAYVGYYGSSNCGVRPVVVLTSGVQFTATETEGLYNVQ